MDVWSEYLFKKNKTKQRENERNTKKPSKPRILRFGVLSECRLCRMYFFLSLACWKWLLYRPRTRLHGVQLTRRMGSNTSIRHEKKHLWKHWRSGK